MVDRFVNGRLYGLCSRLLSYRWFYGINPVHAPLINHHILMIVMMYERLYFFFFFFKFRVLFMDYIIKADDQRFQFQKISNIFWFFLYMVHRVKVKGQSCSVDKYTASKKKFL